MGKKIFWLSFFLVVFLLSPKITFASKEFSSYYKITYEFSDQQITYVTQEISLVNKIPDIYISQYVLSLRGINIEKPEAFDKIGPCQTSVQKKDQTTIITINFNEKVVGEGKILSFILKYQTKDLAFKEGNLWQISVPKLIESEEIQDFQVVLKVPQSFGRLAFIHPHPQEKFSSGNFQILSFTKDQVATSSINATFGQYQVYQIRINYILENKNPEKIIYQFALPPDTNYQTMYYSKINPNPYEIKTDEDGNWIASYVLAPEQKIQLNIEAFTKLFSQPQKRKVLNKYQSSHLSPTQVWETENEEIKKLAQQLKTPKEIYNFVVKTLNYDYEAAQEKTTKRTSAYQALQNPNKATCSQFTDLFIALCRAAGIPAREIVGWAKAENLSFSQPEKLEIFHSWPEYFDQNEQTWKAVDPTWGQTTKGWDFFNNFDMNHLAFVIHGIDSQSPHPLVPLKDEQNPNQIEISLSEYDFQTDNSQVSIVKLTPPKVFSWKITPLTLTLHNDSYFALYNQEITTNTSEINPKRWTQETILPFTTFEIKFFIKPAEKWKDYYQDLNFFSNTNNLKISLFVQSLSARLTIVLGSVFSIITILLVKSLKKKNEKTHTNITH